VLTRLPVEQIPLAQTPLATTSSREIYPHPPRRETSLLRHAVRQRQKEHLTRFQLRDADEFKARLLAQIGVYMMQKFPLLAL